MAGIDLSIALQCTFDFGFHDGDDDRREMNRLQQIAFSPSRLATTLRPPRSAQVQYLASSTDLTRLRAGSGLATSHASIATGVYLIRTQLHDRLIAHGDSMCFEYPWESSGSFGATAIEEILWVEEEIHSVDRTDNSFD